MSTVTYPFDHYTIRSGSILNRKIMLLKGGIIKKFLLGEVVIFAWDAELGYEECDNYPNCYVHL